MLDSIAALEKRIYRESRRDTRIVGTLTTVVSIVIGLGLPLAVLAYLLVKRRSYVKYFLFGVVGFVVSQVILRTPILDLLKSTTWFGEFYLAAPVPVFFLIALSAALFEEPARVILMRSARDKEIDGRIPLFYGLGHGGIEAVLFVGIPFVSNLIMNPAFVAIQGWMPLLAGVERLIVMGIHVALSFIVYTSIMTHKVKYFWIAIALHTLIDFSLVITVFGISPIIVEVVLLAGALITIYVARRIYRRINTG